MSRSEPHDTDREEDAAIRVLNVLFDDRQGGACARIVAVGARLRDAGIETSVLLPEGVGEAQARAEAAGLRVLRAAFATPAGQRRWRFLLALPRDVWRLARLIRRERPDVVHVNGAFFLAPALAARLAGRPLLWFLNDTIVPRPYASLLGLLVRACATRVAVAAEAVAGHYGIPRAVCALVHAPVDTERLTPGAHRPDPQRHRIGLVGNWTWVKGIEIFLEAAARVRAALDDPLEIHLVGARLATQPAYAERIDRLIDDLGLTDLTFRHGYLEDPERVVGDLDLLVLSSHSEACPQAVLEAMALAVPVAATDVGGVRELLRPESDRPAGLVVPPRDPEALSRAILDLLADPDRAAGMGRNGRALAESDFSLAICTERHRALYLELAGETD